MSMVVTVAIIATGTGVVTPDICNWHTALFDSTAKLANKTIFSTFNPVAVVCRLFLKYCSCFSTFSVLWTQNYDKTAFLV